MKNIIIYIVLLVASVNSFAIFEKPLVYTKDDARNLVSLIKTNAQSEFCASGMMEFAKTIRSYSGAYCDENDPKGSQFLAALALGVCMGFEDFNQSHCYSKAVPSVMGRIIVGSEPNSATEIKSEALTVIVKKLSDNPKEVCDRVADFLPGLSNKCIYLIQPAKEPIKITIPEQVETHRNLRSPYTLSIKDKSYCNVVIEFLRPLFETDEEKYFAGDKKTRADSANLAIVPGGLSEKTMPENLANRDLVIDKIAQCLGIKYDKVNEKFIP
ncbi:MAG TPA: hypothetical protein VEL47_03655 [Myxococcota bacterium]|nr:hypothetical protein [Myxococcota bacterium]